MGANIINCEVVSCQRRVLRSLYVEEYIKHRGFLSDDSLPFSLTDLHNDASVNRYVKFSLCGEHKTSLIKYFKDCGFKYVKGTTESPGDRIHNL